MSINFCSGGAGGRIESGPFWGSNYPNSLRKYSDGVLHAAWDMVEKPGSSGLSMPVVSFDSGPEHFKDIYDQPALVYTVNNPSFGITDVLYRPDLTATIPEKAENALGYINEFRHYDRLDREKLGVANRIFLGQYVEMVEGTVKGRLERVTAVFEAGDSNVKSLFGEGVAKNIQVNKLDLLSGVEEFVLNLTDLMCESVLESANATARRLGAVVVPNPGTFHAYL